MGAYRRPGTPTPVTIASTKEKEYHTIKLNKFRGVDQTYP